MTATDVMALAVERGWRNPAHRGAFRKGYNARKAGAPCESPYYDHRTYRGSITFSRSFDTAWCEGWNAAKGEA